MGGIMCVTPHDALFPEKKIQKVKHHPTAEVISQAGKVDLQTFHRTDMSGLQNIEIEDLEGLAPINNEIIPSTTDIVWLYGKWSKIENIPGWNGFMEQVTSNREYKRFKIKCLPFINALPTQYDTVFTSLLVAADKCRQLNQNNCFVTYDQPLYLKARDIIATGHPELNNVTVRLGGFHLLMSFMGSVGFIMAGSGLKDLFSTIYAENSVDKIISGHAYARAVRAHLLSHLVLSGLVWDRIQLTEDERAAMADMVTCWDQSMQQDTTCYVQEAVKNMEKP